MRACGRHKVPRIYIKALSSLSNINTKYQKYKRTWNEVYFLQ